MGKRTVTLAKEDIGNGKQKVVVREREYDLKSWDGFKAITTFVVAILGITVAVLTTYYTAEASQDARIADQQEHITKIDTREGERDASVKDVLTRINNTLTEQHTMIRDTKDTLIEVKTTQTFVRKSIDEMAEDIKELRSRP